MKLTAAQQTELFPIFHSEKSKSIHFVLNQHRHKATLFFFLDTEQMNAIVQYFIN